MPLRASLNPVSADLLKSNMLDNNLLRFQLMPEAGWLFLHMRR
jgi:hypothetical protein